MAYFNKVDNTDYNTRYANWNKFFEDLENEIKLIRNVGNELLFDFDSKALLLNKYYSLITNLYSTHKSYILDSGKIKTKLDKIEDTLFSNKFLTAISKNPESIKELRIKMIRVLREIFSKMCNDFSVMGLRPKIEEVDTSKYSDLAESEEEKEELRTLEQIGIIRK